MIKVLEAYCKAKGYQGGHICMVLEEVSTLLRNNSVNTESDPYKWGQREGKALRHGYNLASYPVPVNSWKETDSTSTIEYIAGLSQQLDKEFANTEPKI